MVFSSGHSPSLTCFLIISRKRTFYKEGSRQKGSPYGLPFINSTKNSGILFK
ncbi:hypothetical protein HOLDEFILI_02559 [Holdemania filiformis DSM 12042]|uniref:Uncharacterized protein n=1 Tax=Holdemania filiformis DSM 12042 TaxID=545696 RepID=B9Y9Q3_9FIRM|nr:hypothetical protein HOLDEFILI_02559 [Holdemania filiformis DSM 12042]